MKTNVKILGIIALAAIAVFFAACPENFGLDSRLRLASGEFVPVETITGVPTGGLPFIGISLTATVMPENATNKKIDWSITDDGGTGATLDENNRLTANGEGTVTVRATIKNGLAEGADYTQDFPIVIALVSPYAVKEINGIPVEIWIGDYELKGRVAPSNAAHQNIVWSVKNAGTTGAEIINGNMLRTTSGGTVVLTATVQGGLLEKGDFTHDFSIVITKEGVYASGYRATSSSVVRAYYWRDGEYNYLDVPAGTNNSCTSGILYANGKQYIAGWYGSGSNSTPCYWVDGVMVALAGGASNGAHTLSIIAADGGDIYITGEISMSGSSGTPCYWKITGGTGAGTMTTMPYPTGTGVNYPSYTGCIAVNNGDVYIPFSWGSYYNPQAYYWDETGTYHLINQTFNVDGINYSVYGITSVAFVNGTMYIAGLLKDPAVDTQYKIAYWVKDSANCTVMPGYQFNVQGGIKSIIVHDGALRFYGISFFSAYSSNDHDYCSWDASGNQTFLPDSSYEYNTSNVVYSDGDVYVIVTSDNFGGSNAIYNLGFTVLGGRYRRFSSGSGVETENYITGIAVP